MKVEKRPVSFIESSDARTDGVKLTQCDIAVKAQFSEGCYIWHLDLAARRPSARRPS